MLHRHLLLHQLCLLVQQIGTIIADDLCLCIELVSTATTYIIIINDTLARSLEPVATECKEHTIHTQTQSVASRKPKV